MAQNDEGATLAEAEAMMTEMGPKFRAGGGVVEVKERGSFCLHHDNDFSAPTLA